MMLEICRQLGSMRKLTCARSGNQNALCAWDFIVQICR